MKKFSLPQNFLGRPNSLKRFNIFPPLKSEERKFLITWVFPLKTFIQCIFESVVK